MRRCEDILNVEDSIVDEINEGFENDGSNLSGVCGHCSWFEQNFTGNPKYSDSDIITNFKLLAQGFQHLSEIPVSESIEFANTKVLAGVHLIFNYETGILLNIALK